ncbi:MAG: lipoyl synthase [Planctomycetes bacterium]|nr:lipoyl synthase [Planctomycetota bacterium]
MSGCENPRRLPPWLKKRLPCGGEFGKVAGVLKDFGLNTVCSAAHCPNRAECHSQGTATFMIMGDICTRGCAFCAVTKGRPAALRDDEPEALAQAAQAMGLRYVVITSVTRDDLADGGARHFVRTISAVKQQIPGVLVEVLTSDFGGDTVAIDTVLAAEPDVFDHNIETVPRLYDAIRKPGVTGARARYDRSLAVLEHAARQSPRNHRVKSGLMLGAGETDDEISAVLGELRQVGVEILTLGQYLAPSSDHWPVERYVTPERFEEWKMAALAMGFGAVLAGPFVRSSYKAHEAYDALR